MRKQVTLLSAFIFTIVTMFAQSPTSWDGSIANSFSGGSGAENDPYLISNASELAYLASTTNQSTDYADTYFQLTQDIDLNLISWTPIGRSGLTSGFNGNLDGNGKAILNLQINSSDEYCGFFGIIRSGGSVKNLGIKNNSSVIGIAASEDASIYVGAIAGQNNGVIINCYNEGSVSASLEEEATSYAFPNFVAGGIVGLSYGLIEECYNTGNINASKPQSSWGNTYAAGIAGQQYNMKLSNCYNSGTIGSIGYAGGLVGQSASNISHCYNVGEITSSWGTFGAGAIAGIVGAIDNCYYLLNDNVMDGGAIGKSEEEMKSEEFVALLNQGQSREIWKSGETMNNGYPVFQWQGEEAGVTVNFAASQNGLVKAYYNGVEVNNGDQFMLGVKIKIVAMPDKDYVLNGFLVNDTPIIGDSYILYNNVILSGEFVFSENVVRWDGTSATSFGGGSGTKSDPYQIFTPQELAYLAEQTNKQADYSGKHFKLMNNLDLNLIEWTPIGKDHNTLFGANFDGNYKTIANLAINTSELKYCGLFGAVNPVEIKNLGIIGASNISFAEGNGGAIAGLNHATIINCYSECTITASYLLNNSYAGGIAGKNSGNIINCYNKGRLIAEQNACIGGITSENGPRGSVQNCYNVGLVSAANPTLEAACVVYNEGEMFNNYCLENTSANLGGAETRSENELKTTSFVALLNNSQVTQPWMMDEMVKNSGYPILKWQAGAIFTVNLIQPSNGTISVFTEYGEIQSGDKVIWNQEVLFTDNPDADYIIDYFMADATKIVGNKCTVYDLVDLSAEFISSKNVKRWDGSVATSFSGGIGEMSDPFLIHTPAELAYLAKQNNSGVDYENVYFKLMNNLDMRLIDWEPIGNDALNAFKGTFDGNGKTIANLSVAAQYAGLFGFISHLSKKVENLGITGVSLFSSLPDELASSYVGALAGRSYTTIADCYNRNSYITSINVAGGIVGHNEGIVINCYHTGKVEAQNYVGGIAGINSKLITNCYNSGFVETLNEFHPWASGIAGYNDVKGEVFNSYYLEGSCPFNEDGSIVKSAVEMKSDEFAQMLNKEQEYPHWASDVTPPLNNGFLILTWQDERTFKIETSCNENGTISPTAFVTYGTNYKVEIIPDANYHIIDVVVDGESVGAVESYEFQNVITSHTIFAVFEIDKFTITATAGPNGTISPETTEVEYGAHQQFTMIPDDGYMVEKVLVDGVNIGVLPTYTFTAVKADHTISVTFTWVDKIGEISDSDITVYASGSSIVVEMGEASPLTIQLFDSTGVQLYSLDTANDVTQLDVKQAGMYVVKVMKEGKVSVKKVVVSPS